LRIAFAHFGRFSYVSAAAPANSKLPESSWEWTFGRMLAENPNRPVYSDLSYFSEIYADADKHRRLSQTLRRFIRTFDPELHHLMFGIMLGVEKNHEEYTGAIEKFLRDDCAFDAAAIERFFLPQRDRVSRTQAGRAGARAARRVLSQPQPRRPPPRGPRCDLKPAPPAAARRVPLSDNRCEQ
jgi:hypothetical protein